MTASINNNINHDFGTKNGQNIAICPDEVLSNNPSAAFALGDLNVTHKDWHTYPGGTDQPVELCYNFSI